MYRTDKIISVAGTTISFQPEAPTSGVGAGSSDSVEYTPQKMIIDIINYINDRNWVAFNDLLKFSPELLLKVFKYNFTVYGADGKPYKIKILDYPFFKAAMDTNKGLPKEIVLQLFGFMNDLFKALRLVKKIKKISTPSYKFISNHTCFLLIENINLAPIFKMMADEDLKLAHADIM